MIPNEKYFLRWEISGRIDSASGVQPKTEVDCAKSESDEERGEVRRELHVVLVRHGHDDQHKQSRAQHLQVKERKTSFSVIRHNLILILISCVFFSVSYEKKSEFWSTITIIWIVWIRLALNILDIFGPEFLKILTNYNNFFSRGWPSLILDVLSTIFWYDDIFKIALNIFKHCGSKSNALFWNYQKQNCSSLI